MPNIIKFLRQSTLYMKKVYLQLFHWFYNEDSELCYPSGGCVIRRFEETYC